MGNLQNRKRKRVRNPPSKMAKKFKHGDEPCDKEAGPSGTKIGAQTANFGVNFETVIINSVYGFINLIWCL